MLKRTIICVLVIGVILAVGCGKTRESVKEEDGVAPDRVLVEFTVPFRDSQVSDLLESLGSHVMGAVYYSNRVQVSVPEGKTAADMVETLNGNPLVECAEPYYLFDPHQVVVQFKVAVSDSRVSALLESLGSHITQSSEYSDFVLVSVPQDKTVAEMVESLSTSPLVEYAEPNHYFYI